MAKVEPKRNVYVGHRYVPKIFGEWDNKNEYEGLSIVTHEGNSYTSKKRVPVGIDILNEEYWVVTGNYNAQVEYYRDEVRKLSKDVESNSGNISSNLDKIIANENSIQDNRDSIVQANNDITTNKNDITSLDQRLESVEDLTDPTIDRKVVNVPTDFSDLQTALDYGLKLKQGIKLEIMIESGFKPKKGVSIEDQDASHITISSVDDIVSVDNSYTGHFIYVYKGKAPLLNCLIDSRDLGGDGLRVMFSSSAVVNSQCGVINAGGGGVYCRTSTITAPYSIFTGSNDRGAWITRASNVSFAQADFSGTKQGAVSVYISRASIADFSDAKINDSNATDWAIYVVRSKANFINAQFNNSSGGGLIATSNSQVVASEISARNARKTTIYVNRSSEVQLGDNSDLSYSGNVGLHVVNNSRANAIGLNVSNSTNNPLIVESGSSVNITDCNARVAKGDGVIISGSSANLPSLVLSTVTGTGLKVTSGSSVNFENGFIQGTHGFGIDISHGSTVNARNALIEVTKSVTGVAESGTGVRVSYGSTLNLVTARVRNNDLNDVNVRYGSTISANGLTTSNGSPEVSDTNVSSFNSPSGRGIMYV